jgi:outer membrane murein-binding lipoprotein Lpp
MSESAQKLKALMERLETERDELKLKVGLAKLEAREEWEELEGKIDALRGRMKVLGSEARDATDDVAAAAGVLAEEVREGLARLRRMM